MKQALFFLFRLLTFEYRLLTAEIYHPRSLWKKDPAAWQGCGGSSRVPARAIDVDLRECLMSLLGCLRGGVVFKDIE